MPNLGTTIRRVRLRQHLTLEQVAQACHCTKSLLSKIENQRTVPALATLLRIADALGVSAGVLMGEGTTQRTIHEPAAGKKMVQTEQGYRFAMLAAARTDKTMQPVLFTIRKGEVIPHSLRHAGEEFIYLLQGTLRYRLGTTTYTLHPGDSLYFDAEEEHEVIPVSATATYLAVLNAGPDKITPQPPKRSTHENRL